jgi:uncharacterized phiE125 gp8 family phage protein
MTKEVTTMSTVEPVNISQAKTHMRITHDEDDEYIRDLVRAARERAETYCGRSFVNRTIVASLFEFASEVELKPIPAISVSKVEYRSINDVWITLNESKYKTDRLPLVYLEPIPELKPSNGYDKLIKITYLTGPSVNNPLPYSVKQAILMIAQTMYDNREDVIRGMTINQIPQTSEYLLNPYRTFKF